MPNGMILTMMHTLAWLVLIAAAVGFIAVLCIGFTPARDMVRRMIHHSRQ